MTYLHIDIETLPALHMTTEERQRYAYASVPKTYKKPESIAKWIRENTEEQWRRTSLDPMHGLTWMVGVAVNDLSPDVLIGDVSAPSKVLRSLNEYIGAVHVKHGNVTWVGKSLRHFDLPWLAKQALLYDVDELAQTLLDVLAYPYDKRVKDVSELWPGNKRLSLDPMANWLGVGGKTDGMHGSKVYDAYVAGDGPKVAEYCAQDVRSTRDCWKRLTGRLRGQGVRPEPPAIPADILALI
jgi:3'-5' exonuclease